MINPNVSKLVTVYVPRTFKRTDSEVYAFYKDRPLRVYLVHRVELLPGNRRLRLKYSILANEYYLTDLD